MGHSTCSFTIFFIVFMHVVFTLFYPKYEIKFNVLIFSIMAFPKKMVLTPGDNTVFSFNVRLNCLFYNPDICLLLQTKIMKICLHESFFSDLGKSERGLTCVIFSMSLNTSHRSEKNFMKIEYRLKYIIIELYLIVDFRLTGIKWHCYVFGVFRNATLKNYMGFVH